MSHLHHFAVEALQPEFKDVAFPSAHNGQPLASSLTFYRHLDPFGDMRHWFVVVVLRTKVRS